jgi:WD40 repeat protein
MVEDRLNSLLSAWQEQRLQGRDVSAAELCRDCPELAPELGRRIAVLRQMDQLRQAASARPGPDPGAAAPAPGIRPTGPADDGPEAATRVTGSGPGRPDSAPGLGSVPGYEILGELGRGGMGVVYQARQTGLKRLVALKMILAGGHAGEQEVARFRAEAEAVARLQHPNIVQIHEVGEAEGRPFFSLEYVEGGNLADRLKGTPLPPRQAAELVQTLARAVQAAHQAGIIHRDLKPANVLLTRDGQPKITDFGLAKQLDTGQRHTQSGAIVGTPSYMAPEQAEAKGKEIGPAADIYALGAILYELLTGRPPFKAATPLDTLLQVVSEEPAPPSQLQSRVPRDLETICLKCLEKVPARRYGSGQVLADDLGRFLAGEPIAARPVGRAEKLWRWCQRNPRLAAVSGLAAAAVVTALAVSVSFGIYQAQAAEDLRQEQQATKEALKEAETARDQAASRLAEQYLDRALVVCSQEENPALGILWLCRALESAPKAREDLQRVIRTNLNAWKREMPTARAVFSHQGLVDALAFSPDGKVVLTGSGDYLNGTGEARLWSAATGQPLGPALRHQGKVLAVAFSPDGKTVLTGCSDGTARLWSAATGRPLTPPLQHQGMVMAVAFSPDGQAMLTGSWYAARLWSVANGQALTPPLKHQSGVTAVAFSPDGQAVLTGSGDLTKNTGEARLWSAATGQPLGPPLRHQGAVWAVASSPDGKAALTGSQDKRARLWSAATGQELTPPLRHQRRVTAVAFSPDGRAVLTGSDDRTAQLWSAATGRPLGPPLHHQGKVDVVAFSPDGKAVLTASGEGKVINNKLEAWGEARLWSAANGQPLGPPLQHHGPVYAVAFSPDGQAVLTGSEDKTARLWSAATGHPLGPPFQHQDRVIAVAFSPDGKAVLTGSGDYLKGTGEARLWSAASGQPLVPPLKHQGAVLAVAFSPNGKAVLTGSWDKTARLWSAATGHPLGPPFQHQNWVKAVAFSPDGKAVLTGSLDPLKNTGEARLWKGPDARGADGERIKLWIQVLTGIDLDDHGAVQVLDDQTLQACRQRLEKLGGPPRP